VFAFPGSDLRTRRAWGSPVVQVGADGAWSVAFESSLASGPYTLFVKETDANGFVTGLSRTVQFTWSG
jgi:hypothetical protein